jgi:hypothetical protein
MRGDETNLRLHVCSQRGSLAKSQDEGVGKDCRIEQVKEVDSVTSGARYLDWALLFMIRIRF